MNISNITFRWLNKTGSVFLHNATFVLISHLNRETEFSVSRNSYMKITIRKNLF